MKIGDDVVCPSGLNVFRQFAQECLDCCERSICKDSLEEEKVEVDEATPEFDAQLSLTLLRASVKYRVAFVSSMFGICMSVYCLLL